MDSSDNIERERHPPRIGELHIEQRGPSAPPPNPDALHEQHPDEEVFTFWDYFRQHWQRNAGLRIDHLLLNPELAPRLADAGVDSWVRGLAGASDHAPTWISLASHAAAKRPRGARS